MLPAIGMAAGMIPAIMGLATAGKQARMSRDAAQKADKLNAQTLGFAKDQLGQAQGMYSLSQNNYQGRGAGMAQAEQNIYTGQANTMASMGRNARSSADMLALAGASQGQSNAAFQNLAAQEAMDKQRRFGDLTGASNTLMGAQGNMQGYYGQQANMAQDSANQLMNASMQNKMNAVNQIGSSAMMGAMGAFGDMSKILGGSSPGGLPKISVPSMMDLQNAAPMPFGMPKFNFGLNLGK